MFPVTDDSQTIIDCLEGGPIMDSCAVLPWRHIIPCGTSTRIQEYGIFHTIHNEPPSSLSADLSRFKAPQHQP